MAFVHNIITLENIKISSDAIDEIISISDGSVRDCLSILNQTQGWHTECCVLINKYEFKGVNFYKLCFQLIEILLDKLFHIKSGSLENLKILNESRIVAMSFCEPRSCLN